MQQRMYAVGGSLRVAVMPPRSVELIESQGNGS